MTTLLAWLTSLDEQRIATTLRARPDVRFDLVRDPLTELADLLVDPDSLRRLIARLPLPHLQVMECLVAMGSGATLTELTSLLLSSGPMHEERVREVVGHLTTCGVVWPPSEGRLQVAEGAERLFPRPLGLGPRVADLLDLLPIAELRRLAGAHGLADLPRTRPELEIAVEEVLTNREWLRGQFASAPAIVFDALTLVARPRNDGGRDEQNDDEYDEYDEYDAYDYDPYVRRQRVPHRREVFAQSGAAFGWAKARGMVISSRYGYEWHMPAEVELVLRGPGYHPAFAPLRPVPTVRTLEVEHVHAAATAAASDFAQQTVAVLDILARSPWPLVQSGGVGVRDMGRLAKAAVVEPGAARLALELAAFAGLLVTSQRRVTVSDTFDAWREQGGPDRYAQLLVAWWELPFSPTNATRASGTTIRALERFAHCQPADRARQALIGAMSRLPPNNACDLTLLLATVQWDRPRVPVLDQEGIDPWNTAWAEAESLGVIACGALTAVGRALPQGNPATLAPVARGLLPTTSERAAFGSDLTVVLVGSPSARLSLLLDSCADRESSGAAITWRLTPDSVRRAFDAGTNRATLTGHLLSIATTELPQPLCYLLADVERRHGELRLSGHGTLLRGDDPARVAEAAADRSLHRLGLKVLAPTILTSRLSVEETLEALRKAGYLPTTEAGPAELAALSPIPSRAS
ncbi:helicase-associated domain-containing protein [Acidothermaceae bacterium B102]|nr:helicase-associated domain-containing protein [Acidothermaceae bacterium B102]